MPWEEESGGGSSRYIYPTHTTHTFRVPKGPFDLCATTILVASAIYSILLEPLNKI